MKDLFRITWNHQGVESNKVYKGSLLGAKMEATRNLTYQTSAYIYSLNGRWTKEFWSNGNEFGWNEWIKV